MCARQTLSPDEFARMYGWQNDPERVRLKKKRGFAHGWHEANDSVLGPHSENRMAFKVEFSPRARDNLKKLRKRDQQIILDAIAAQLTDRPDQPTRKRKRLEDNLLSPWELRVGDFRVFYDVNPEEELVVAVAVGHKIHNIVFIGDEEVEL